MKPCNKTCVKIYAWSQGLMKKLQLINSVKAQQDALCQTMGKEIAFLTITLSWWKLNFQIELEGLKTQLKEKHSRTDQP